MHLSTIKTTSELLDLANKIISAPRIIHRMEQGSLQWHQIRSSKMTGTGYKSSPQITKEGKVKPPSKGYRESVYSKASNEVFGYIHEETYTGSATEYGHLQEPIAKVNYEARNMMSLIHTVGFVEIEGFPLGCSPDFLEQKDDFETEKYDVLGEIKCPISMGRYTYYTTLKSQEDITYDMCDIYKYREQVLYNMFITGVEEAVLLFHCPNPKLKKTYHEIRFTLTEEDKTRIALKCAIWCKYHKDVKKHLESITK